MKVSEKCEEYILAHCPPFCVNTDAPNTFKGLKEEYEAKPELPVYGDRANPIENTIFSSAEVYWAFRAWHDKIHVVFNLPFTMDGEFTAAGKGYALMREAGVDIESAQLCMLNIITGIELYYAAKEAGLPEEYRYTRNQEAMTTIALLSGIAIAVEGELEILRWDMEHDGGDDDHHEREWTHLIMEG